jgi:hypothetical protein
MDAKEAAAGLELLAATNPELFGQLASSALKDTAQRPAQPMVTIWPPGSETPITIHQVDRRDWLKAGATETPPGAMRDVETPSVAPPAAEPSVDELRRRWQAANPGERCPPRAGAKWFSQRLDEPEE